MISLIHNWLISLAICLVLTVVPAPLQAQVKLVVGMEQNPPICFIDENGKAQGISVEILNEVARKEGWQITYFGCVWEQCLQDLATKKLDLLVGIGFTQEREKFYDFNREAVIVNWAQVYTGKDLKALSPLDLANKRIVLVPTDLHGAAFLDTLKRFNISADIIQAHSYEDVLKTLLHGAADAGVVSRLFPVSASNGAKLYKTPIIFNPIQNKLAAPKGHHQDILQTVDRYLAAMRSDNGSNYFRIVEKQLGMARQEELPVWTLWLLAGSASLLALSTIGYLLCSQRIRKRTAQLEQEAINHQNTSLALQTREEQLRTIIATTGEGYLLLDPQLTTVLDVNIAFCQMLGYQREDVIGAPPVRFVTADNWEIYHQQVALFGASTHYSYEMEFLHHDGHIITVHCNTTKLPDEQGLGGKIFAFITDISDRKGYEAQLRHQAHHDLLTGLPNRLLLYDRVEQAILHGQRHDTFLVLLLLDLDNFKVVNDTLGHSTGDLLLKAFAERASAVLRQGDTFTRFGGDEFVILPESIQCNQDVVLLTQRIFKTLETPFDIDGHELFVTVSIGVARYPDDGTTADTLLKHADAAMYLAKREGKNDFRFFTRDLDTKMHERLSLETRLRRALERQEFELYYQPQVAMATGQITGVEALLRWRTNGDIISPADFIPVLEETGLILQVGEWVLRTACVEAASWHSAQGTQLKIAVNLSARQFQQQNLVGQVATILHETRLQPDRLVLELTESLLMECSHDMISKLDQLAALGVALSIDDFGTGYSSLAYLASLPIHELKIDRSFISTLPQDGNNAAIIQAVTALAVSLQLHVVVEGVETREQALFLQGTGLNTAQGFLYSRPVPGFGLHKLLFGTFSKSLPGS